MKKILLIVLALSLSLFFTSCVHEDINVQKKENLKYDMVATWINYLEINEIINCCETNNQFEKYVVDIISNLKEYRINTIFLQVRAFDDTIYESEICPVSEYCKNKNNELKFDVLKTFIDICKKNDIELHAWINPYRIRNDNKINMINKNSYAYDILNCDSKDEKLIITDNGIFYNPAYQENQKYILDCIKEIINKYDVQGIHIDDYFYSSTSKQIDKQIYNRYLDDGGKLTISEYRRNCINTLVTAIHQITSEKNLIFSISPCADMDKNFDELYADVKYWSQHEGFVDYIIPQLYYGFENDFLPFEQVFNEWIKLKSDFNNIVIGIPLYKIGEIDKFAGNGMREWTENNDIILRQIKYSEQFIIDGFAFYSSSYLYKKSIDEDVDSARNMLLKYINKEWIFQET